MIGFLIRAAFWFTIVLIVLPFAHSKPEETDVATKAPAPESDVSSRQAVTALQGAVSDVSGFCERRPDACDAGKSVLSAVGARLRDGAETLVFILDEALTDDDPAPTGSGAAPSDTAASPAPAQTGTLTPADRSPEWQGGEGKLPPV